MVTRSRPDAPSAVRALGSQRARVTGGGEAVPRGRRMRARARSRLRACVLCARRPRVCKAAQV